MEIITVLLFALGLSTDTFFVGIAYGIKRIIIPICSMLLIVLISAFTIIISMNFGKIIASILPVAWASRIGALILLLIAGCYFVKAGKAKITDLASNGNPIMIFNLSSLGVVVQILKEPFCADFDASGEINLKEAFFLGMALSLDALGAGIGAAMAGLNIWLTAVSVAVTGIILIKLGLLLGTRIKGRGLHECTSFLIAGLIFMTIGSLRFILQKT